MNRRTNGNNEQRPAVGKHTFKRPAMRDWLIRFAQLGRTVTYGEMMQAFDIDRFSLRRALGNLGNEALALGEPVISALVVYKTSGDCGPGFTIEFQRNDETERRKLYRFWRNRPQPSVIVPEREDLEEKAIRFVSVEARPEQAAFRRKVFLASGGRCVISGCDVLQALDAAHKTGRDWRAGHNTGDDGYLMRKDLHALYDANLLQIKRDRTVVIDPEVKKQYGQFSGVKVPVDGSTTARMAKSAARR